MLYPSAHRYHLFLASYLDHYYRREVFIIQRSRSAKQISHADFPNGKNNKEEYKIKFDSSSHNLDETPGWNNR